MILHKINEKKYSGDLPLNSAQQIAPILGFDFIQICQCLEKLYKIPLGNNKLLTMSSWVSRQKNLSLIFGCVLLALSIHQVNAVGGCSTGRVFRCSTCVAVDSGVPDYSGFITITVTTTLDIIKDDGITSLREAIITANVIGGDVIILLPNGTPLIEIPGRDEDNCCTGDFDIIANSTLTSLTINTKPGTLGVDAQGLDRHFDVLKPGLLFTFKALPLHTVNVINGAVINPSSGQAFGGSIRGYKTGVWTFQWLNFRNNSLVGASPICTGIHCGLYGGAIGLDLVDNDGIGSQSSKMLVVNCTFTNNYVRDTTANVSLPRKSYGGAIGVTSDTNNVFITKYLNITACSFLNNSAERGGGAVAGQQNLGFYVRFSTFTNNQVLYPNGSNPIELSHGGGIFLGFLSNVTFSANSGGSFPDLGMRVQILDCSFTSNSASLSGGGVAIVEQNPVPPITGTTFLIVTITSGVFTNNTARMSGAGAFIGHHTTTQMLLCKMANNTISNLITTSTNSETGGGALLIQGGATFSFLSGSVVGNISPTNGGGIHHSIPFGTTTLSSPPLGFTISDTLIYNNSASLLGDGGGISILYRGSSIQFQQCNIFSNLANRGGGIFVISAGASISVLRSSVTNNTAITEGGGIFCNRFYNTTQGFVSNNPNGGTQISLSTISGNIAKRGSGISLSGNSFSTAGQQIIFSTIVYNTATDANRGAGIDLSTSSSGFPLAVIDTIIAENIGNITNEILYSEDFHIVAGSSCNLALFTNLIQDQSELVSSGSVNVFSSGNLIDGSRPNLGPLLNNGGSTLTHLPNACSIVRNIESNNRGFTLDQRNVGFPRTLEGLIDLGSVESISAPCSGAAGLCHFFGCNSTGFCISQTSPDLTFCDDGIPPGTCQNPDVCLSGVCTPGGTNPALCSSVNSCFIGCTNTSSPECQFVSQGSPCSTDDGLSDPISITCIGPLICQSQTCQQPSFNATRCTLHARYGIDCFTGCNNSTGACEFIPNGSPCDDGISNPSCVGNDTCVLGTCSPNILLNETLCESLVNFGSDCFTGCNNSTRECEFIPNGSMCNNGIPDGSCQNPDKCINGICESIFTANVTECSSLPQYGTDCFTGCNATSFECTFIPNGESCDDGIPNGSCQNPDLCTEGNCISGTLNATLCELLPQYGIDCFIGCNITTMNCDFYSQGEICINDTFLVGTCQNPPICESGTCTEGSVNETLCQILPQYGVDCFIGCSTDDLNCLFVPNGDPCDNGITEGNCITNSDICSEGNCISSFEFNQTLCSELPQYGVDCFIGCNMTSGNCTFIPNGNPCDDENTMTFDDMCSFGMCIGLPLIPIDYQCGSFLCNNTVYSQNDCTLQQTIPSLCELFDDGNDCTRDYCDVLTGLCLHEPAPEGKYCNYWNNLGFNTSSNFNETITSCTTLDTCIQGVCTRGSTIICNNCTIFAGTDAFRLGVVSLNISVPQDFFGIGSDSFANLAFQMEGSPLEIVSLSNTNNSNSMLFNTSLSEIHLLIERSDHAYLTSPDDIEIVPIHIVALNLKSVQLFYPEFSGIPSLEGWNLYCELSNDALDTFGTFSIRSSDCNCEQGGKFIPFLPSISLDCNWKNSVTNITLNYNGVVIPELLPAIEMPWFGNLDTVQVGGQNLTIEDIISVDQEGLFVYFPTINETRPIAPNNKKFYPGIIYDKCDGCDFFSMCRHDKDCDDGLVCTTDSCESIVIEGYDPHIVRFCKNVYHPSVGDRCYYGPENTLGIGECSAGAIVCLPLTGCLVCAGQILPSEIDLPGDHIDSNCNGDPNS